MPALGTCYNKMLVAAALLPATIVWTAPHATSAAAQSITVNNTRAASGLAYTAESGLFAFRSLTNSAFGETRLEPIAIPRDVILGSILSFDEIDAAFSEFGLDESNVTIDELREVIEVTSYDEQNLFESRRPRAASLQEISFRSKPIPMPGVVVPRDPIARELTYLAFNAATITNLVAAGALTGVGRGFYVLGDEESGVIRHVANNLYHMTAYKNDLAGEAFAGLLDDIRRYDGLSKSFLAYIGRITFGLPIPLRAEEMELVLPNFIQANFDVYWVELTATYREMADDTLEEMVFNVSLPKDCIALELIPIRYGTSEKVLVDEKSPELKVKIGPAEISVGEFFGKKVAYDVIRPTIVGYGKGENVISWSLHDEAVSAGSHNFVAIVGLPKGSTALRLAMAVQRG